MGKGNNKPIDFVILWVDGSDKKWLEEKSKYQGKADICDDINRYRDWEFLKYLFRGIEQYTPWINNVFFVTCGHVPGWLNLNNPKLKFIKHSDFIPEEYLPTFSANPIELNLHRIKDLSENFVYFNDDLLILRPLKEETFFKNDLPCDAFVQSFITPDPDDEVFSNIQFNSLRLVIKYFNKFSFLKKFPFKYLNFKYGKSLFRNIYLLPVMKLTGIRTLHSATSMKKSTFSEIWKKEHVVLDNTCKNKFRNAADVNQYIISWFQIMSGKFSPINPKSRMYCEIGNNREEYLNAILNRKADILCLNDVGDVDFQKEKEIIIDALEKMFPNKSSFEI